jgi:hypothetical protein
MEQTAHGITLRLQGSHVSESSTRNVGEWLAYTADVVDHALADDELMGCADCGPMCMEHVLYALQLAEELCIAAGAVFPALVMVDGPGDVLRTWASALRAAVHN